MSLQQGSSSENTNILENILDLLKEGEEQIKLDTHKDVLLVLGNTGSGKSTFTRYIAGYDENLISLEKGTGQFVIVDNNDKISSKSTIVSHTIFPELVLDTKTNTAYFDCPGFSDTRSAAHDIAGTYFVKKLIDSVAKVKLVFTVNYSSVKSGNDRQDFILLVKHAVSMIKNVEKFKDSIALVVTKVDNEYKKYGNHFVLISDQSIIENIAGFLTEVKDTLSNKAYTINIPYDEKFRENAINFINILLEKNDQTYSKIGIFRKPDEAGIVSKIVVMQQGKKSLEQLFYKNIHFTTHDKTDFGYTISSESQIHLHGLAEKINENIALDLTNIGNEIQRYYLTIEKQSHDIYQMYDKLRVSYDTLLSTKNKIGKYDDPHDFIKQLTKDVNDLKISVSSKNLLSIIHYINYLNFIKDMENKSIVTITPLKWEKGIANIVEYLDHSQKWYNFLITLYAALSKYEIQQDISKYENAAIDLKFQIAAKNEAKLFQSLKTFLEQVMKQDHEREYDKIKEIKLNPFKLIFLRELLNSTLKRYNNLSCKNKAIIVRREYVKLSDIANINCKPKSIEIFALNKIFIDSNLDNTGAEVQLSIIAPTWDIIGSSQITLDGKIGEPIYPKKAENGILPGDSGKDGQSGHTGGSAGNFLGIGEHFINGEHLKLSAIGGVGGSGQAGGDGAPGRNGNNPTIPSSEYPCSRDLCDGYTKTFSFQCQQTMCFPAQSDINKPEPTDVLLFHTYDCNFKFYGTPGGRGGNGGNGGKGGKRGNSGIIVLIELGSSSKVLNNNTNGEDGDNGVGGSGGIGGKNGDDVQVLCQIPKFIFRKNIWYTPEWVSNGRSPSGTNGTDGANDQNIENPTVVPYLNPSYTINNYKNYLRENLRGNIRELALRKFLNHLEDHKSITTLYDVLGFVNELQKLEEQFYNLRQDISFVPFYKSFLHRITNYAENISKSGKSTKEYKKVLSYLYTAALSKISSIKSNLADNLVVDLPGYLDLAIIDIKKLKDFSNFAAVGTYQTNYQQTINAKIKEANNFIDTQITAEINNIINKIEHKIESLLDETLELQKKSKENAMKLIEEKHKLEEALVLRKTLGGVKIASQFLSFLGPVGAGVGAVSGGAIMITESLVLDDTSTKGIDRIAALPGAVKSSMTRIADELKNKQLLLKEQLQDAGQQLKDFLASEPSSTIKEIDKEIFETKQKLEQEIARDEREIELDPFLEDKLNAMRQNVTELLESKKKILEENKAKADLSTEKTLAAITKIQHVVSIGEVSVDFYGKIRNHQAKIDNLGEAITEAGSKIKELASYENEIYKTIIPICKELENNVKTVEKDLEGKSHVALDISKWQIQSTIRDIKLKMQKMTKGFKVQEDFLRLMDKLDEGMTIMIDVYDRIQDYYDKAELASYIADINSKIGLEIDIENRELRGAVDSLKLIIQSNLVLEKYEIAMNAIKQYIFPFADSYLVKFDLPTSLKSDDPDSLLKHVVSKMEDLKSKISESVTTITKYDKHIYSNILFSSNNNNSSPFFVWEHNLYKHSIAKLLEGEEITLKSDVTRALTNNAIKFNDIGIRFKLNGNESLQNELDDQLQFFYVTMVHLGNSYYKCGNKFYVITHDKQTKSYNLDKTKSKHNMVLQKIKNNPPVLSPYTLWNIKLTNDKNNFTALAKYKDQVIDLELEGRGQYVDRAIDDDVCNDNLDKYYKLDNTETDFIDTLSQQDMQGSKYFRSRRSARNNMEPKIFVTSGAASNHKSSLVNNIFNLMSNGLIFLKHLNPVNKIAHYFTKYEDNVHQEGIDVLENNDVTNINKPDVLGVLDNVSKYLDLSDIHFLPTDIPEILNETINSKPNEYESLSHEVNDSLLYNHANLLLLDVITRLKTGEKRMSNKEKVSYKYLNFEYAQCLAYREYAREKM